MTGKESFSYTWVNPYQLSCPGSSVGRALAYMGGHFRQNSRNRLDPEIFIMVPRIFGVESFILRLGLLAVWSYWNQDWIYSRFGLWIGLGPSVLHNSIGTEFRSKNHTFLIMGGLDCRVSWVRIPPRANILFFEKEELSWV